MYIPASARAWLPSWKLSLSLPSDCSSMVSRCLSKCVMPSGTCLVNASRKCALKAPNNQHLPLLAISSLHSMFSSTHSPPTIR